MLFQERLAAFADTLKDVRERIGRNTVVAAIEIDRQRIGGGAGDDVTAKPNPTVLGSRRFDAKRPAGQFQGHRGLGTHAAVDVLRLVEQRDPANDVVFISENVDITYVFLVSDGEALAWMGADRFDLVLNLAEHDLALLGAAPKRDQEFSVEPLDVFFDRRRENHVEADDLGARADDAIEHGRDLVGPHRPRDELKRRAAIGFLVDRDDGDRRVIRPVARAERGIAQPEQAVERYAVQPVERRRRKNSRTDNGRRDQNGGVACLHWANLTRRDRTGPSCPERGSILTMSRLLANSMA